MLRDWQKRHFLGSSFSYAHPSDSVGMGYAKGIWIATEFFEWTTANPHEIDTYL